MRAQRELVAVAQAGESPPALARHYDLSREVVAAHEILSPQVEALRAVRGALMLRWLEHAPARKSLAVLSAAHGEGRSFVAANLAVAFAQIGVRTLLVDADLRASRQHELFGLDNGAGLSAVLAERAAAHEVLQQPLPNLWVLPAGPLPPSPQDLLARPGFARLLQQLEAQADLVLLDSPPFGQAADAQTIAVRAAAALIVVRKHASRMWRVQGVSASVIQAKTSIVGAVLNEF
jgi:receptor protein-tyrosine kinase